MDFDQLFSEPAGVGRKEFHEAMLPLLGQLRFILKVVLVDVNKVKLVFSKTMDIEQPLLLDASAYEVLVDKKSVGPIVDIRIEDKKIVERVGVEVEGVTSVVLTCSGPLRGKSLDVRFCKELKDVDGNIVNVDT